MSRKTTKKESGHKWVKTQFCWRITTEQAWPVTSIVAAWYKQGKFISHFNFTISPLQLGEYMSQIDTQCRVKLTLNIESNWLSISSQIDSQYRGKLTLNIESNWLSISSQIDSQYRVKLTLNIESNWLSISSQIDSQYRVKLTLNIESNWLSISSQIDSQYRVNLTQKFSNYSESLVEF